MIIYIVGINCVGKTTVGRLLARQLNFQFFDLDDEVEKYYKMPIERIQDECFSMNCFREKASKVLDLLISQRNDAVIAGTPSGLKYSYLQVYKKNKKKKDLVSIHLIDRPDNIVERLSFFDKDSIPIVISIDEVSKKKYIKKIKDDYSYFKNSLERADLQLSIENVPLTEIPILITTKLNFDNCQLPVG